jgi:hypothetical protein
MPRFEIVILIYHRHEPIDLIHIYNHTVRIHVDICDVRILRFYRTLIAG